MRNTMIGLVAGVALALALMAGSQEPDQRATPERLRDAAPHVLGYCTLLIDGKMFRWPENEDGWCELRWIIDEWPETAKPLLRQLSE